VKEGGTVQLPTLRIVFVKLWALIVLILEQWEFPEAGVFLYSDPLIDWLSKKGQKTALKCANEASCVSGVMASGKNWGK
jgi:hypothetical protein